MHERLKKARNAIGLTQTEFAQSIGATRPMIAAYESGKVEVPEPTLRLISVLHGISYEWLKYGKGNMQPQTVDADVAALTNIMTSDDEFAKSLFRTFARLGPNEWRQLRMFMEGVLRETDENEQKK